MEPLATPDLDADRDPDYAQQAARVSRVARAVLAVVLGLALLGVFGGGGVLSRAGQRSGELGVRYDRFARLDAPLALTVSLPPGDSTFQLTEDLARDLQVEAMAPAPSSERSDAEGRWMTVGGTGPVTIHARPLRFGLIDGEVRLADGPRVPLRLVVYP